MYRVSKRGISSFNVHPSLRGAFKTGVVTSAPGQTEVKHGDVVISQLSNGARIITQDLNEPTSAIGIYCTAAGAKYDPSVKPGLNYVMRYSLMTSNMGDSHFQLDKAVRSVGGSLEHQEIRKSHLGWKLEVRRDAFQPAFNIMQNCVTVPRFAESDIHRFRDTMDAVYEELRWQSPREYAVEGLEQIAYYKEPCGNPRYVPPTSNDDCSADTLVAQWSRFFVPQNIVIAAVNVDHAALVASYENSEYPHSASAPHFRDAQPALTGAGEQKQYQGGREEMLIEKRYKEMSTVPYMEAENISAIGWRVGGYDTLKDYATSLVMQQLIDIQIQDGIRVHHPLDKGLRSFYSPMSSVGLIGLTTRSGPEQTPALVKEAANAFKGCASKDDLPAAVQRAKVRFLHDHIETRRDYVDFLATSIGVSGAKQTRTVDATLDALDKVKVGDVEAMLKEAIAASPCLFSMGAVDTVPSMRQMGLSSK